ncbi:Uncharacterized protein QTN25_005238 [Entamoeba marina]
MSQPNYQLVEASPNRVFNILKSHKLISLHLIVHHLFQFFCMGICIVIMAISFAFTDHTAGKVLLITESIFNVIAIILFIAYIVFFIMSIRTHPVLTTNSEGKVLFAKITNMIHTTYLVILFINSLLSLVLALSFDPQGTIHDHKIDGLWYMITAGLLFIQLSCSELQKPLIFITRKTKPVELELSNLDSIDALNSIDALKETGFVDKVGVITIGINFFGFQTYVKYHFDPNRFDIQTEIYFVGWVKNF